MSTSVAIGVFDGLHVGHQALFDRALARAAGGRCVALSFDPHPDVVLARHFKSLPPLTPLPEKLERLAARGIELQVLPFTRELAALSPEDFVAAHLVGPFAPDALIVGEGFALGRARAGDVGRLREIGVGQGFEVDEVPLVHVDGEPVSSTRVRARLAAGQVAEAARLLGRRYTLEGHVVTGERIGRTLGYPTANLRLDEEKLVPADGIYAVWVRLGDAPERVAGAMSVGLRPTFGGGARTLEVFLLDWQGDLYGRPLTVEFVDWIRGEQRFDDAATLTEAIAQDVERTRQRLGLTKA